MGSQWGEKLELEFTEWPKGALKLWQTRSLLLPGLGTVQSGLIMSGPEWEHGTRTVFPVDSSSVTHAAVSARALGVKEELGVRRAWGGVSEQSAGIPKRAHSYKAPPCG